MLSRNILILLALMNIDSSSCFAQQEELTPQAQLQKAILNDSPNEIDEAIKAGAQINFQEHSKAPLLKAVLLKKHNAASALLKAGANPSITYQDEKLVHYIMKQGEIQLATSFINAKADFSGIVDKEQDAFTFVSTRFTDPEQFSIKRELMFSIVNKGYDLKKNFYTKLLSNNAWYQAIINGDVNCIGYFLNWGGKSKKPEIIKYALPIQADVNQVFTLPDGSQWTPLLLSIRYFEDHIRASQGGTSKVFSAILNYGSHDANKKAKPLLNKPEQNPISFFLYKYKEINSRPEEIFKALLEQKASLTDGFRVYLESGGNSNQIIKSTMQSHKGFVSLLWLAVQFKDIEATKFLINKRVDVNLKINPFPLPSSKAYEKSADIIGHLRGKHTPLYFAMQYHDTSIADLLIEHGAQV